MRTHILKSGEWAMTVALCFALSGAVRAESLPPMHSKLGLGDKIQTQFFIETLSQYDSNPLRVRNGTRDYSGYVFPGLSLNYVMSPSLRLHLLYRFGLGRYVDTSLLNTSSHFGVCTLTYRANSTWSFIGYNRIKRSNQPDVWEQSPYRFASYLEDQGGLKVLRYASKSTLYQLELSQSYRSYSGLQVGSDRQRDGRSSVALSRMQTFSPDLFMIVQGRYQINRSNNPIYRYRGPSLIGFLEQGLGAGVKLELMDQLSLRDYPDRTLSSDPRRTRYDQSNTLMIGMKRNLAHHLILTGRYYFQKNFSNEPLRHYSDHLLTFGIRFSVGESRFRFSRTASAQPTESYSLARQLLLKGDPTSALSKLEQLTRVQPRNARVLTDLGYAYLMQGQYDKAIEACEKAIALNPGIAEAHTNLGIAYYKKGRLQECLQQWRESLKLDPSNAKVQKLLDKLENNKAD